MRQRRSREFWRDLCDKYQRSSLTQRQFAKRHDVNRGTFQYWLYTFRKEARAAETSAPTFVEIATTPVGTIEQTPASSAVLVSVGARLTLDFYTLPSPAYLAALIHAIDEVSSC